MNSVLSPPRRGNIQYGAVIASPRVFLSEDRSGGIAIYTVRTITRAGKSKRIFMHRLIANTPPHLVCDHINHDGLDNRKQNLRNCTVKQNNANSRPSRNSPSKYKGISWNRARRKWAAYIKKNGRQFYLGCFDNEAEAARAYDIAAREHFGEFALLNFPNS